MQHQTAVNMQMNMSEVNNLRKNGCTFIGNKTIWQSSLRNFETEVIVEYFVIRKDRFKNSGLQSVTTYIKFLIFWNRS